MATLSERTANWTSVQYFRSYIQEIMVHAEAGTGSQGMEQGIAGHPLWVCRRIGPAGLFASGWWSGRSANPTDRRPQHGDGRGVLHGKLSASAGRRLYQWRGSLSRHAARASRGAARHADGKPHPVLQDLAARRPGDRSLRSRSDWEDFSALGGVAPGLVRPDRRRLRGQRRGGGRGRTCAWSAAAGNLQPDPRQLDRRDHRRGRSLCRRSRAEG